MDGHDGGLVIMQASSLGLDVPGTWDACSYLLHIYPLPWSREISLDFHEAVLLKWLDLPQLQQVIYFLDLDLPLFLDFEHEHGLELYSSSKIVKTQTKPYTYLIIL